MDPVQLLLRGVIAGLAISAPVGPVNVLCIKRTFAKGKVAGMISGLGAATADTVYGAIAGFSISFIIRFLMMEEFWLRSLGGLLLVGIGCRYYFKKPGSLHEEACESSHCEYVTTLFLTLTNPTTVLSFLAVLAVLGLGGHQTPLLTGVLIGGIFFGAMAWWAILAVLANHFRDRFDDRALFWMNRVAGVAMGGFGIVTLILSRSPL
jgi:threonine/homoserine/homoserine lactone efflux protein